MKIEEEDWRCFRLIDREVYLGWPLPIAISRGGMGLLEGGWIFFSFSFLFLVFGLAREEEESGNIFENRSWNCVLFLFFFLFLLIKVSKVISNFY